LAEFRRKVADGGEVNTKPLASLTSNALVLGFARYGDVLIGVGAIKRPYGQYRDRVFEKAASVLNPSDFDFELGWFYIDPAHRGKRLTSSLVSALLPLLLEAPAYATSRTDNVRMHSSLRSAGFREEGTPYQSKDAGVQLQLFVCGKQAV
jgi:RimJ/RimL family protein N-acetyltransferase